MKRTLIGCALLAGMAMANTATAQDYDDRWYLTAGGGYGMFDGDRNVDNEFYGTLGIGKFVSPNFSVDLEAWHSNPELDYDFDEERNWELMSLSLVGRYHFGEADSWRPYVALGIGMQEHHDSTQTQPLTLGFNDSRTGNNRGDTKVVNAPINAFGRAKDTVVAGGGALAALQSRVVTQKSAPISEYTPLVLSR